jgi:hypothetical protein
MAAQTKGCLFCAFHVVFKPEQAGKNREDKERQKCQYLSPACNGQVRTQCDQSSQNDRYDENSQYQSRGHAASERE